MMHWIRVEELGGLLGSLLALSFMEWVYPRRNKQPGADHPGGILKHMPHVTGREQPALPSPALGDGDGDAEAAERRGVDCTDPGPPTWKTSSAAGCPLWLWEPDPPTPNKSFSKSELEGAAAGWEGKLLLMGLPSSPSKSTSSGGGGAGGSCCFLLCFGVPWGLSPLALLCWLERDKSSSSDCSLSSCTNAARSSEVGWELLLSDFWSKWRLKIKLGSC